MQPDIIRVFVPAVLSFFMGILIEPAVAHYLYKHKMWKKKNVAFSIDGAVAAITAKLHGDEERKTPRMGGIVVWGSVLLTSAVIWLISRSTATEAGAELDYVSRSQTWIPLATLLIGALIGFVDDFVEVTRPPEAGAKKHSRSFLKHIAMIAVVGFAVGAWFYFKLGVSTVALPFFGAVPLGWLFIPFFMLCMIALYGGGVIDGVDGLSGGVFAIMYGAYSVIAFFQDQIDLAAFSAVVSGATLAFLWFNIPPARFFLSETGTTALTITLVVVAFMADEVGEGHGLIVLPVIALPLIATAASSVVQILSKKFRNGKKVFIVAPLHNHFQAKGWPAYKVAMRYWVITAILAFVGITVALAG